MKIFFDGGLRPGGMEWAVVAGGRCRIERGLGPGTSMDAEWLALLAAMSWATELAAADAIVLGDAAAVIAQANGTARVPPAYRHHHRALLDGPRPPGRVRLRWVKRTQNLAGIALARERATAAGDR